jgi:hypothetical protein
VIYPRSPAHSRDAVDLQTIVALHFTTNLDELIFGEVRTNLENAPRALLAEVAIADRDNVRLAHYIDLKATTRTLRGPGWHVASMPEVDRLSITAFTPTPASDLGARRFPDL